MRGNPILFACLSSCVEECIDANKEKLQEEEFREKNIPQEESREKECFQEIVQRAQIQSFRRQVGRARDASDEEGHAEVWAQWKDGHQPQAGHRYRSFRGAQGRSQSPEDKIFVEASRKQERVRDYSLFADEGFDAAAPVLSEEAAGLLSEAPDAGWSPEDSFDAEEFADLDAPLPA
jgi:hypothetical protein